MALCRACYYQKKIIIIKRIVFTGPEATGKSLLAEASAKAYCTCYTPEFARYYLEHLGRNYHRDDLATMAKGQIAWSQFYATKAQKLLFEDTDMSVICVWHLYKYGFIPVQMLSLFYAHLPDLYFICCPDFPWTPDPLRENPHDREVLLDMYRTLLQTTSVPCVELTGLLDERMVAVGVSLERM